MGDKFFIKSSYLISTKNIITILICTWPVTSIWAKVPKVSDIENYIVEAEACSFKGPFKIIVGSNTAKRTYLHLPAGTQSGAELPSLKCSFNVEQSGFYEVKLLIRTAKCKNNLFTVKLEHKSFSYNIREARDWRYRNIPELFYLNKGEHELFLHPLCDDIKIDKIIMVYDPIFQESGQDLTPPFEMPSIEFPVFPECEFKISDFGGVSDGTTKNTEAFRRAIQACANAGGGKVVVPAGKWLTGPIHLKSNVNLHLEKGAVVFFSTDVEDYLPAVFTRWAGFECYNYSPLIYARDCENIAITGQGKFYGQGQFWWYMFERQSENAQLLYKQVLDNIPPEKRIYATKEDGFRPQFFAPINCRKILLEDVSFYSGPFWTVHLIYCEHVHARRLKFITEGPNNDGLNCDSCRNVLVEYCYFNTDDDALAIKSGINEDGWRVGRPSENIIIRHCRSSGSRWGGISFGSDTSGGIKNVFIHDVHFADTRSSLYLKSTRGRGGTVEDIFIQNIEISGQDNKPIKIDTKYRAWFGSDDGVAPIFRNINISNLKAREVRQAMYIQGLPEQPLENIKLQNISILDAQESAHLANVSNLTIDNLSISLKDD